MSSYVVRALPESIATMVREGRRAPGYDHPVLEEVASGTGPCRSCLRPFVVGVESRLLFTYRPPSGRRGVGAPGPVFIHAEHCGRFEEAGFPEALRAIPLLVEGRTDDGRILQAMPVDPEHPDLTITACLADPAIDFLFVRHAEAGCHVARVERTG